MKKPLVALVGRPNVGKSTLFNRLVAKRLAVVDDVPGTTRDRLIAEAEWAGQFFDVVDTGGIDPSGPGSELRGQPLSIGSAEYVEQIRQQAEMAIREADAVLFLTDAESGVTPADREVAQILRRLQRQENGVLVPPVFLVVNKADNPERRAAAVEFYELGLGEPYPISALHGTGTGDLLDALVAVLPKFTEEEPEESVKVAIVGRPNVGKSSLLNRLLGQERVIVSPIPGTTRDAVDTYLTYGEIPVTLIDTAGIRRRGRIEVGVEKYSVLRTLKAIERSDVALLVLDATSGITAQDAHIAGYILDAWKSVVIVVNKWDTVEKKRSTMQEYTQNIRQALQFLDYAPILFVSARTGFQVEQVLPTAIRVQEERLVRLQTSKLNQILQDAIERHAPPTHAGKALKIYYATQVRSDPPTFLLYVNDYRLAHFTYLRYLENCLREEYPYEGTPIRFVLKNRRPK
ncbi:MAG: ribosome biogenesis GTPase Der [Anaerolineales bacterium]|nr:ribosome biogenesis GTPase Der [Anaerolineales bacterium]MDW8160768.1 ribosome biogenesis GTPase Der [Anaerolineales bacterium]